MRRIDVREELADFALAMEAKLSANDHKAHWRAVDISYLFHRLHQELNELETAHEQMIAADVRAEAVDVANFAMMIFDRIEHVG